MSYDKRINDLAAIAAAAAGKNARVAPQLLLGDITFALADAVEDGRIVLGPIKAKRAKPLLCRLGLHKFTFRRVQHFGMGAMEVCDRCGKGRILHFASGSYEYFDTAIALASGDVLARAPMQVPE
jgi:hypothetical protein